MKKTLISLATASLIASSAVAADKGIDFTTTGQAVVYYQTANDGLTDSADLFNRKASSANIGVQLNSSADLKNGFTFGSQISYLGTTGLEKNLVSNTQQVSLLKKDGTLKDGTTKGQEISGTGLDTANNTTDQLMLTKIFVAKQIANTTVKIGRQELPKSLSPLAFSEGWNVFKNTFDAVLVVNSDLPNTTLVGAYVGRSTGHDLSSVGDLTVKASVTNLGLTNKDNGSLTVAKTAYMLTAQNTALPMTTVTASYYALAGVETVLSADALWLDVKVADKSLPMGLKVGVQAGMIMPEVKAADDTTAMGLKASIKPMPALTVCGAYTHVSGSKDKAAAAVKNTGTGVKTPLFTQMVANQDAISLDNSSFMLKGAYRLGDIGTVIAQTSYTQAGKINLSGEGVDYTEFDLIYKVKVGEVNLLAAYVSQSWDTKNDKSNDIVRVVARYTF